MGFKDIIQADLTTTFFNTEEFADQHTWGNKTIKAIVDDDALIAKYSSEYEFLSKGSHMVLAPVTEFTDAPKLNAAIYFDGILYTINELKQMNGMYILYLDMNRS